MPEPAVITGAPPPGRIAIVDEDGSVSTVDRGVVAQALAEGARVASPDELRGAQNEARYGGAGGALAAAGAGAARGLTLGLSDPLAVAVGGEGARRTLQGLEEANPLASGIGEGVGTIAPLLASGGTSALARGVAEAGAAPRAAARFGGLAERGVSALVGEGGSALGRIGRSALGQAASGAAEASLYGAGQAITEATLGNHELTAEDLWAHMGGTAALGAAFSGATALPFAAAGEGLRAAGGALRRGGSGLRTVLEGAANDTSAAAKRAGSRALDTLEGAEGTVRRTLGDLAENGPDALAHYATKLDEKASAMLPSSEELARLSDESAWRSLYGRKKFSEEAKLRAGGTDKIGRVLKETGVIRAEDGVIANALSPEDLLPRIQEAKDRIGKGLGDIAGASNAAVKAGDIATELEAIIDPLRSIAGREGVVSSLEGYRDSLYEKLGAISENGRLKIGHRVPLAELRAQRIGLQDIAYAEAKSLDPGARVEFLRSIRGALDDLEVNALVAEGTSAETISTLKRQYQGLRIAEDAARDSISRLSANRSIGATDYLAFIGGGGGVTGAGLALANKLARERGSAAASVFLDDLAKTRSIASALKKVGGEAGEKASALDAKLQASSRAAYALNEVAKVTNAARKEVVDGVKGFIEGASERAGKASRAAVSSAERAGASVRTKARELGAGARELASNARDARFAGYVDAYTNVDAYERKRAEIEHLAQSPGALAERMRERAGGLADHAPSVSAQLAATGARSVQYLNDRAPKRPFSAKSLTPFAKPPRPIRLTPDEAGWMRRVRAVEKRRSIFADMRNGSLTPEAVDAVREVYPQTYAQIQNVAQQTIADYAKDGKPLSIDKQTQLAVLLDVETEFTTPEFLSAVQAARPAQDVAQPQEGGGGSKPINIKTPQTAVERVEST